MISIDWGTYTINIPKADLLLLQSTPIEVRQLDLTTFHEVLRDLEDDPLGMPQPVTHNYKGSTEISGVILAQVVEILDPYTVTFEDGAYAVNIVGGNSNVADKVNINNVGVRTANSAGLQDLSSLQAASFGGAVAVKSSSPYSAEVFPIGTRGYPVNNLFTAHEIAENRGLSTFAIMESITFSTGDVFTDGYVFLGDNPATVTVTLEAASNTSNCEFNNLTVQGEFDGNNIFKGCHIVNAIYVTGFVHECALTGTITLNANSALSLLDCYSNVPGGGSPVIDFDNAADADLAIRNWSGGLALENLSSALSDISIDMASGRLFIRSNCTGGTVIVRGVAEVIDESAGAVTIIDETVNTAIDNIEVNVGDLSSLTASLNNITNTQITHTNMLTIIDSVVDANSTKLDALSAIDLSPVLSAISTQTTTLQTDIAGVSTQVTGVLSYSSAQFTAINTNLDAHDLSLEELKTHFGLNPSDPVNYQVQAIWSYTPNG